MMTSYQVAGIYLEETEGCECERQTIHFKFKYFFSKDPCEKCLVRAACQKTCEPKYIHWDEKHSIIEWKRKLKNYVHTTREVISVILAAITLIFILTN